MSTAGSEVTTGTPAAAPTAATTPDAPAAPARNKGGRPSNASKAAAAAASATAPVAAKTDAPAAPKAAEIVAPAPAATALPEDTVGGRKAAEEAKAKAEATAEATASAPKSKTLDQVKAERRAKAEAEAAKGTSAATPAAAETDEAKAAAKVAAQATGADKTEEQKAADLAAKEADDKTKADAAKKKAETVETDIPADKLKEFTKLNRDLRTATARVRELEADAAPVAARLKKAADLAKEGKHYDAIRALKADGIDFDKAAAEVLRVTAEDADLDPETKKLRDDLAAANDRLAKLENGQTQAQKDAALLAAEAAKVQKEKGIEQVVAEVTLAVERFPYLSKDPEFVREALEGADEAYPLAVKHLGRALSDDEKNNLLRAALEEAEDRHAARAKLYGVKPRPRTSPKDDKEDADKGAPAAAAASASPTTTDGAMRGASLTIKPHGKRTLADIKAARRQAGRR